MVDERTAELQNCGSSKLPSTSFIRVSQDPVDLPLPLYGFKLVAGATTGFASPAQDYESEGDELDINKHLVSNPAATFIFLVGKNYDSMVDAGIMPGSRLVVDRSIKPAHRRIVVAAVDGEWVVKRLHNRGGVMKLLSENREKNYAPIEFKEGQELGIFGVVKHAINDIL